MNRDLKGSVPGRGDSRIVLSMSENKRRPVGLEPHEQGGKVDGKEGFRGGGSQISGIWKNMLLTSNFIKG